MSVKLEVRSVDFTDLGKQFANLGPKLKQQGVKTAIRRTMTGARVQVTKFIRQSYFIKSADVKSKDVQIKLPSPDKGELRLVANRISLGYFGVSAIAARRKRAGVRVKVAKTPFTPIKIKKGMVVTGVKKVRQSSNKVIPGSFAIKRSALKYTTGMRGEGYAIFVKSKSRKGGIRQLFGPSTADLLGNGSVMNNLVDYVDGRLRREIEANYKFYISEINSKKRVNR